jgi:CheY-like chemotaxis protein
MQVLVIDRDEVTPNLIRSRLEPVGHHVFIQTDKSVEALETIARENWDIVFLDPSPLTNPRPLIQTLRRGLKRYTYMVLLSSTLGFPDAIASAMNDFMPKPIDSARLDLQLENAARLTGLIRHMSDDSEDFKSAGGVIAKSAFNQLFLSCIERADRYGENSYLLFFTLSNYAGVVARDGEVEADIAVAKMAKHLVRLRRQSDIIGQIRKNEYVLLLQRPAYESEPVDAANRFAEALSKCTDIASSTPLLEIELTVTLMDLPVGSTIVSHTMILSGT